MTDNQMGRRDKIGHASFCSCSDVSQDQEIQIEQWLAASNGHAGAGRFCGAASCWLRGGKNPQLRLRTRWTSTARRSGVACAVRRTGAARSAGDRSGTRPQSDVWTGTGQGSARRNAAIQAEGPDAPELPPHGSQSRYQQVNDQQSLEEPQHQAPSHEDIQAIARSGVSRKTVVFISIHPTKPSFFVLKRARFRHLATRSPPMTFPCS